MSFETLLTKLASTGIMGGVIGGGTTLLIIVVCVVTCRSMNSQQRESEDSQEAHIDEETALLRDVDEQTKRNATALQQELEEADRLARKQVELNKQEQALLAQLPEGTVLTASSSSPTSSYQGPGFFEQSPTANSPTVDLSTILRSSASPSSPRLYPALEPVADVRSTTERRADKIKSKEADAELLIQGIEEQQHEINQALADLSQRYPSM